MSSDVVSVDSLTFHYPTKTALKNVSFAMPGGQITALVGPNGAGKSTLMRCIAGLDTPFSGKITVAGTDVLENPRQAHAKIGYLSDSFGLYDELSVTDNLTYIGGCHQLAGNALSQRVDWVIGILGLGAVKDQKCGSLSRGWRQRTGIGMSIIHRPEILILDEPASGLDPEARSELSHVLKTLQKDGISIIVSSHILAELEEYCTAMLVIRDGAIVDNVTLATHCGSAKATVMVTLSDDLTDDQEHDLLDQLGFDHNPVIVSRTQILMNVSADVHDQGQLLRNLMTLRLPVCGFAPQEKKLQTLYLEMAQERSRA